MESRDLPTKSSQVPLKSCLKKNAGSTLFGRKAVHPLYTADKKDYGEEREARITITPATNGYRPGILPLRLRNYRRTRSLNPHFLRFPKTKHKIKRHLYVRLGIIELSLQNGLGSRYRLVPPPKNSFDFPMKCVSNILWGCGCKCCIAKLREEACLHVVTEWDTYKWDVKYFYSFHVEFFRQYNPSDPNEEEQQRAQFFYKIAVLERMYECTRLEIGVACELHQMNFYCLEAIDHESFRIIPSATNFSRSVYFFAKEIPYAGRMVDKKIHLYDDYYLIWLNPVTPFGTNLTMQASMLRITYSSPEIGYFHLMEEDPLEPIYEFLEAFNLKRVRHQVVRYAPIVYVLHYYERRSFQPWHRLMQAFGIYQEPEVDERIVKYDKLMVNRFHNMEKDFLKLTEDSFPAFSYKRKEVRRMNEILEEYLSHLKNRTTENTKLKYKGKMMKAKYIRKWKRNRARMVAISQKYYDVKQAALKKKRGGPPKKIPHHNTRHQKHRISRHTIRPVSPPTRLPPLQPLIPKSTPSGKKGQE